MPTLKPRRGRPRKFARPSKPVTLTLPTDTIEALRTIDDDLGRAVVRLAGSVRDSRPHPPAELQRFGRRAVIVVNPTRTLKQRAGIDLVPLTDGRALISFDRATTIAAVELMIADALEDRSLSPEDEAIFAAIADILRSARRSSDTVLLQKSIILLEARRAPRHDTVSSTARAPRQKIRRAG